MSDKPSAAWYLAPIFLGIIGSAIMWFVLKDEEHPDSPKMIKKGWIIGIVLTLISLAWIPLLLIPFVFIGVNQQQMQPQVNEPIQQLFPAPGFEDVPEMIVESENPCDPSYPDVCIPVYPPDLDCGEIQFTNFKVLPPDPHGFDGDKDGIGCEKSTSQSSANVQPTTSSKNCLGSAGCYTDYVTRIVDGDTIHTATLKIRLSLTNSPETYQDGFNEATEFTEKLCPVGSKILVDQDDLERVDQYGRVLAKVFCGDKVLNSELLYNGHANILTQYCSTSEFSGETWAQNYGCGTKIQQPTASQTKENNCDPSYPDVCIPVYPPDLDCGEIQFANFKVLPPDPHGFDGDKDGIGCES